MSSVLTFPGQGAQRPGMLAELPDSPAVRDTLAVAAETLSRSPAALDTAEALADTENVQLALTVVGVAAARHLAAEAGPPAAVMGLSIGAWPAAVVAGVLDFADALSLVSRRGALMAEAYPEGYGMLAVLGLTEKTVAGLAEAARAEGDTAYVANVNADDQIVVAGADDALARLADAARSAGARGTRRLAMAVPSHCTLLDAPAERLTAEATGVSRAGPGCAYFSANAGKRLWQADAIVADLVANMARTVYWARTARIVHESGFTTFIEVPPGATLTGLHPAMDGPGEAIAVQRSGWHNAATLMRRAAQDRG